MEILEVILANRRTGKRRVQQSLNLRYRWSMKQQKQYQKTIGTRGRENASERFNLIYAGFNNTSADGGGPTWLPPPPMPLPAACGVLKPRPEVISPTFTVLNPLLPVLFPSVHRVSKSDAVPEMDPVEVVTLAESKSELPPPERLCETLMLPGPDETHSSIAAAAFGVAGGRPMPILQRHDKDRDKKFEKSKPNCTHVRSRGDLALDRR